MGNYYASLVDCVVRTHDGPTMALGGVVCTAGIHAGIALSTHAIRAKGAIRIVWGLVAAIASGCTAWATHFIVLLAFNPGMPAAFEPFLTIVSMISAILGIGIGVTIAIRYISRSGRFIAGIVLGLGIVVLHYVGQAAYAVQGIVAWDLALITCSILVALPTAGLSMLAAMSHRRPIRSFAPLLLFLSIAVIHFCGMAAMDLRFDPTVLLPDHALSPQAIAPAVVGVSLALLALAILGLCFDLAAQARRRRHYQHLRALADVTLEGLLICQGDVIVTANASAERFSGYKTGTLNGLPIGSLLPRLNLAAMPEYEEFETQLIGAGGAFVPVRALRRDVVLERKTQTVIAIRDQRERLRLQALAFHDELTGLANRRHFADLLLSRLASVQNGAPSFAVLMLDLDGFKPVNDRFGHAAGDMVLVEVGARLAAMARTGDVVARLGGDEFAVLQGGGPDSETAETLAARIVAAIQSRAFLVGGRPVTIGISIGIAVAPSDGIDPGSLMRSADTALYAAKAAGKGCYRRSQHGESSVSDISRHRPSQRTRVAV